MLINISPSKSFLSMLLPAIFHKNCQAVLAVSSINGLKLDDDRCLTVNPYAAGG